MLDATETKTARSALRAGPASRGPAGDDAADSIKAPDQTQAIPSSAAVVREVNGVMMATVQLPAGADG